MKLIGLSDQFVHLFGTGMVAMGIMDFMDEEEGESADADGGGSDDDLFGDGMGDGMDDGIDDGMDDFGGMDDGMGGGMDGGMDDWADGGDDEFAMGGGGGPTQELENRIDDLENEVAEISSTVGTVRSENEQISSKVDDTEENVRKLLEIYEMVTRGVNPFVDDVQGGEFGGGGALGGDGGSFGLFDGDAEEEDDGDLDSDVANAEAESFFDDDFDEDDDLEDDDFDEMDAGDDLGFDSPDEELDDLDAEADDGEDAGGGQAGGSTFQELKEEYESGEADWADGEGDASPDDDLDDDLDIDSDPVAVDDEPDDGEFEFEQPAEAEAATPVQSNSSGLDSKPYLVALPSGYVSDLVVMEWLEFLVTEFGADDAVRTITYYGDIGWISDSVEEELLAFVSGFADVDEVDAEETGPATLEIDDHIQSLTFLSQLTGDAVQRKIVEHCAQIRGGRDGIQR
ncbi:MULTISPECIES: FlaD/FlaE family flagellar protein [Halorussus]|uniref:FlaD/FlaE family flagellar protein n=1 Tax=Halorussus TaxID=1070314 RepID=UPI0020A1D131|nr:FlaD/FlaE family flagellar protein [Halorussus vallis]USZ76580.1 fla cluster protein flaCE [Halorussus vallis]